MESKYYYANIDLLGRNTADSSKQFRVRIIDGDEILAARNLYEKSIRILNFYGVEDNQRLLMKIAIGSKTYEANRNSEYQYATRNAFYLEMWNFINTDVIGRLNENLFQANKPLIAPYFKHEKLSHVGIVELFSELEEIYQFSLSFGSYRQSFTKTWLPMFKLYFEHDDTSYGDILLSWSHALDKIIQLEKIKESRYSSDELSFVTNFLFEIQTSDYVGFARSVNEHSFNSDINCMSFILKTTIEEYGEPTTRIKDLLAWHPFFSSE